MQMDTRNFFLRGGLQTNSNQSSSFYLYYLFPGINNPTAYILTYERDNGGLFIFRKFEGDTGIPSDIEPIRISLEIKSSKTINLFTIVGESKVYFTLDKNNVIIPFPTPIGVETDNSTGEDGPTNFTPNTLDVNPWGIFLAGVNYTLLSSKGIQALFLTEEEKEEDMFVSTFGVLSYTYYTKSPTESSTCLTKTDTLQTFWNWVNNTSEVQSENPMRAWTTSEECQEGVWYRYCEPNINCGNNGVTTNCKGPCPTGNTCSFAGRIAFPKTEFSLLNTFNCVNSNSGKVNGGGDENDDNFIIVIMLIVIGVVILLAGLFLLILINNNSKSNNLKATNPTPKQ